MADLIVTTASDTVDDTDGVLSLREALALANSDTDSSTITFANAAGEAFESGGTIELTGGVLVATTNVSIIGDVDSDGSADVTFSTVGNERAVRVSAGTTELSGLIFTGRESGSPPTGGGIVVEGDATLTLSRSSLIENHGGNGGALAVETLGTAHLDNVTVTGNVSDWAGGGIFNQGTMTIADSQITGNTTGTLGGGISHRGGTMTITGSVISGNDGGGTGGGISSTQPLEITNSTIASNEAGAGGGIENSGPMTLSDVTVEGNTASSRGGGINSSGAADWTETTLINTSIVGNSGRYGGGIHSFDSSALTLVNSTLTGNRASETGGGIYNDYGRPTLTNTIVLGNSAVSTDEMHGAYTSSGGNLVGGHDVTSVFATVGANSHTGVNSGLLSDNGGPVQTAMLRFDAANPALDLGTLPAGLSSDARDQARDIDQPGIDNGGTVDAGAVELAAPETPGLHVTTTADVVDQFDGEISLREALALANSDADASTITFANGAGAAFEGGGTITLTGGALTLTSDIVIDGDLDGDGDADITLSGGGTSRVLRIESGSADLNGLNIRDGSAGDDQSGGGILVASGATLALDNSVVSGNAAGLLGGGLYNQGSTTLTGSTVSENAATGAGTGSGGGLANSDGGDLRLVRSTIAENTATSGGGIYNAAGGSQVTVSQSTITGNTAAQWGGGAFNNGAMTFVNATIAGNTATATTGGGVMVLSTADTQIINSTISGNTAGSQGGGLYVSTAGTSVLTNSLVLGNSAPADAEVANAFSDGGGNLVGGADLGDVFAATGPNPHTGVQAGVLGDNGGAVATIALKDDTTNPALDIGAPATGVSEDAAGNLRDVDLPGIDNGGTVDAGAVELVGNRPPTGAVIVTGTVEQGRTLTADSSGVSDGDGIVAVSIAWRWLRDGAAIDGATGENYRLTQADVGAAISIELSYTDGRGNDETVTSAATGAVENTNDAPTGAVVVTGTVREDGTLSADARDVRDIDGIDAGSAAWRWLRDGTDISGATSETYRLTQGDVGARITAEYAFTDGFGARETVRSTATSPVSNVNDAPTGTVALSGLAETGEVLTAVTSGIADEDGLGAFSFTWLRDGTAIAGETGSTLTLSGADAGARISVRVSYTDGGGTAESLTSAATDTVENALHQIGTPGADVLTGTAGNDTLEGLDGADRLIGEAGDDSLLGGDGPDTINGGNGNDVIMGGNSEADLRDVIYAGNGNDSVDGGYGNDQIFGMGGNDTLAGGFGADTIEGQNGNDVITGSAFADQVFGGNGADFVNGGFGHDLINGGAGADKFFHVGGSRAQMEGHGSDWVQDYDHIEGDVLVFGGAGSASQFKVNTAHTVNSSGERAGNNNEEEAFIIYQPTGQILWALVDGAETEIRLQIGGAVTTIFTPEIKIVAPDAPDAKKAAWDTDPGVAVPEVKPDPELAGFGDWL